MTSTKSIKVRKTTLTILILLILFNFFHLLLFQRLDIAYFDLSLYFILIPGILFVSTSNTKNKTLLHQFLQTLFNLIVGFSIVRMLTIGLDFNQKNFFFLNKNTVSMIFELIALTLMVIKPQNAKKIYFISAFTSLIIGGKTTFVILITFGLIIIMKEKFAKKLLFACILIGSIILFLVYNLLPSELIHTLDQRFVLWEQAVSEIRSGNIFFGLGIDNFESQIKDMGLYGKTAIHNYYLQFAHAFGLIGLMIFLLMLTNSISFLKHFKAKMVLISFSLHSLVDVGWVLGPGTVFAICYAILKSNE